MRVGADVRWRPLDDSRLPDLASLAAKVLAVDGGLPLMTEAGFLARRYTGEGVTTVGGWTGDGQLVAAASVRPVEASGERQTVATAMVEPSHGGQGLGTYVLDWALARAQATSNGPVTVETESLTEQATALFASRGLRQTFAEDVMRFDLREALPPVSLPAGMTFTPWTPERADRFFEVYEAAFRDRPGFPDWSSTRWIEWISADEDFRPEWSLLASDAMESNVGFVACATGWIVQVGVRPEHRGRRLGAALIVEALRRMRDAGAAEALLDVNVDNPARDLYARLGFATIGRRARFCRASTALESS